MDHISLKIELKCEGSHLRKHLKMPTAKWRAFYNASMCVKAWMADNMTLENMRSEYLFFSYYKIENKEKKWL